MAKKLKKVAAAGVYAEPGGTYYTKYKNETKRGFESINEAITYRSMLKLQDGERTIDNSEFSTVAEDYLEHEYQRYIEESITYGTYDKKQSVTRYITTNLFNDRRLKTIKPTHLRNLRIEIYELDYSTRHKNYILGIIKEIFRHARKYYDLKEDYSLFLDNFPNTKDEKLSEKLKFEYIWTNEDFNNFLKHVNKDEYKIAFTLFFKHGMRLGEVLALQWSKFDAEEKTLVIDGSITLKTKNKKGWERKDPKNTQSFRTIYLGDNTAKLLSDFKEERKELYKFNESWFIISDKEPLQYRRLEAARNNAVEEIGLNKIDNHMFRHMFITNAWGKVPIPAISRYVGHSSIAVTIETYSHLSQENAQEMIAYVDIN